MTKRLGHLAASALAVLGLAAQPADARTLTPEQAPAAWVAYAEDATQMITQWLNIDEPPALHLRAALDATDPTLGQPVPTLIVKIWVGADGALTRIDTLPLAQPATEQDLRTLLVGRQLGRPPKRMRQPIRLALQLAPQPPAQPSTVRRADIPRWIAEDGGTHEEPEQTSRR